MMDHILGTTSIDRHVERFEDQLGSQVIGHRPTDNAPTVGIDHYREIQEAGPGRDVL